MLCDYDENRFRALSPNNDEKPFPQRPLHFRNALGSKVRRLRVYVRACIRTWTKTYSRHWPLTPGCADLAADRVCCGVYLRARTSPTLCRWYKQYTHTPAVKVDRTRESGSDPSVACRTGMVRSFVVTRRRNTRDRSPPPCSLRPSADPFCARFFFPPSACRREKEVPPRCRWPTDRWWRQTSRPRTFSATFVFPCARAQRFERQRHTFSRPPV